MALKKLILSFMIISTKNFSDALAKFKSDAEGGPDAELQKSYLAAHDLSARNL